MKFSLRKSDAASRGHLPRVVFLVMICAGILSWHPAPAMAGLVINELLAAPASDWDGDGSIDYKNDEWVEILNTGSTVADLTGLYLKDSVGDAYHYGFDGVLEPGAVKVVYGSDAVAWQADNGAGSSGLSLNNGGDTLELWRDIPDPRILAVVDVVPIPAHAGGSDRAMGRLPSSLDWVLFDALNPYGGDLLPVGTGCSPSPGSINACDVVPSEETSFGRVKAFHGSIR